MPCIITCGPPFIDLATVTLSLTSVGAVSTSHQGAPGIAAEGIHRYDQGLTDMNETVFMGPLLQ